ncbi:MAG: D-alanyl-D-alanine carboxypeptidase [Candidatus Saccharibacteria bacterium]|nr:D-alanyl-D-alanine carboxypeptidase [Moraxellaceae bacterium]
MSRLPVLFAATVLTGWSVSAIAATIIPSPPVLDNKSYVLMDYDSGQILASSNPDLQLPPASLTKMMTSFIVEQNLLSGRLKETDPVLMNESAWCRGSSSESCMYVPLNSSASVLDMLRGIVIQSGNDASKAMAEHIAGNEGAFAEVMNDEAKRIGMKNTHYMNATGLPMDGHYSSAMDSAILARNIITSSAKYYPIYSEKWFTYNNIKQGNRNALLFTDPSVDGLKTGHTDEAGYCQVTSSKRGSMRLISAVFGTKSMNERAGQTRALLSYGFTNFETTALRPAAQSLATTPIWLGKTDTLNVGLTDAMKVTLPRGQSAQVQTSLSILPNLTAPIQKGQVVGKVIATLSGKTLAERPLVALEPIEEAGFFSRMMDHIKMFFSKLFK